MSTDEVIQHELMIKNDEVKTDDFDIDNNDENVDEEGNIMMHVDGSHAVHAFLKGHSGLFVAMGLGSMMSVSKKFALNDNSSIETEILSNGERFPKCSWFRCFRLS